VLPGRPVMHRRLISLILAMFRYRNAKPTMALQAGILFPPTLMGFLPFAVLFLPATLEMLPSRHPHVPFGARPPRSVFHRGIDSNKSRSRSSAPDFWVLSSRAMRTRRNVINQAAAALGFPLPA